ncbi:glucuronidase, beta, putative [Acanthamoeba castellanii str. Neff]|uniref:Glucuronidase, beta, putative n=1 Tax=Acanthamoeba castellanii (strain ATCC 30010 / Neff) TaxID=1257118 RepID=L8HD44_ACACF|nr:glucuronidase, beta, putative [Acanthamoeba castellanii str. Neff]ELR23147.1 glucuronidase, beta, putative [Acanthamoeba castellanii str. Neff]
MKVHAAVAAALVLLLVATGAYGAGMLQVQDNPARSVKDLSGIWRFKRWWLRPLAAPLLHMPVPASYNDITQDNELRRHIGWVWYERDFFVPHTWVSTGQRIVLRFESVSYAASVWVDGTAVVSHAGGHLPFEADITQLVKGTARSRLTVAVNNTLTPFTLPPGNVRVEHGPRYPKGYTVQETHFDFFNYAGIDREVYLYTTPSQWIDDITLTYDIQLNGDASVNYEYALTLWQPGKPYLYTLEVTADDDVYHLRSVGIRTIKVSGTQFLINGKQFYFHGVDKHEDSDIRGKGVDDVIVVKDYNMLQWLNVSAYRTSHYPYAPQFYDMADERGIVIIDECPAVGLAKALYFNPTTLVHHKQVMYEMIRRDKNHPSVVMWNVANKLRSDMHVAYNSWM